MRNLFTVALLSTALYSCKSTSMCSVSVLQPPPVTLSPRVKNIAVVNRCETTPPGQAPDATGKIFSPEAALESINGLADELNKNNRFTEVKYLDKTGLAANAAPRFPAPLAWDTVQRLCRQSNADVLFVLEVFDNDSKMNYATHAVNVITSQGKVSNTEHQANMLTRVKTGWRIYDPANKKVCDEFIVASDITFDGKGISKRAAEAAVIDRNEAVQEVGNKAGHEYAARVVPYHLKVMRTYYTSGSDNFKMAAAKCKSGDWDGASALWQKETTSRSKKLAGQACYNMAIVSEINGDLKLALQWAQKAYDKNSSTLAQDYITILQERKKNKNTGPPKQSE